MEIQRGVVTQINGQTGRVRIQRNAACGDCKKCIISEEQSFVEVDALNRTGARVGDQVEVVMESGNVLLAAFLVYIVPLITMFLGYIIGQAIGGAAWGYILGGLMLILPFFGLKLAEKKIQSSGRFQPVIVKLLSSKDR